MPDDRPIVRVSRDDLGVIAELMRSFPAPRYVSGGWAIDLFVGRVTREHDDLEIGITRRDQVHLHEHLRGWQLHKCVVTEEDANLVEWCEGEWLELPIHQIVVQQAGFNPPEFEFCLNRVADGVWESPRNASVRRPADEIWLLTEDGIPFLAPEIQLHYKARRHREKDEHDFRVAVGYMSLAQRTWLRESLLVYKPDDPWIGELTRFSESSVNGKRRKAKRGGNWKT